MGLRSERGRISPEMAACVWTGDCPWATLLARPSTQHPLVQRACSSLLRCDVASAAVRVGSAGACPGA